MVEGEGIGPPHPLCHREALPLRQLSNVGELGIEPRHNAVSEHCRTTWRLAYGGQSQNRTDA